MSSVFAKKSKKIFDKNIFFSLSFVKKTFGLFFTIDTNEKSRVFIVEEEENADPCKISR